jgi:hypothetical protein
MDACSDLPIDQRRRIEKGGPAGDILNDNFTLARFNHHWRFLWFDGQPFDAAARGRALQLGARSIRFAPDGSAVMSHNMDQGTTQRIMRTDFQKRWTTIKWDSPSELPASALSALWDGVDYVFKLRWERLQHCPCPEVVEHSQRQMGELVFYRGQVSDAITQSTSGQPEDRQGSARNKEYLRFFFPFWAEHLLGLGAISGSTASSWVEQILKGKSLDSPAAAAPADGQAAPAGAAVALPAAAGGHPAAAPLAWTPPPPYYPPQSQALPPPANGRFVVPALPAGRGAKAPRLTPAAPARRFLGLPVSAVVVGDDIGFPVGFTGKPCLCLLNASFPGKPHASWECPLAYCAAFGACPGWTPAGQRIPTAWTGNVLTMVTKAEWKAFIAANSLSKARNAAGDVAF